MKTILSSNGGASNPLKIQWVIEMGWLTKESFRLMPEWVLLS